MIQALQRLLAPVEKRIANLVSRATVSRVNDGTKLQTVQVRLLAEETREGLERFQQYGLTSVPEAEAEAVVLFVGGRRDHGYVVAVDDRRYRLTGLAPGEVALYSKAGASVVLKTDGSVEVNPAPGAVVKLAGETDAVIRGTTYRSAEDTLLTALSAALSALAATIPLPSGGPMVGTAAQAASITAAVTAIATFQAAASTYLSTKTKTG